MKYSLLFLAVIGAMASFSASAADFTVSGDLRAGSDYSLRGESLNGDTPTIGAGVRVDHATGVYASADYNTVNVAGSGPAKDQSLSTLTLGYAAKVTPDLQLGAGVSEYFFAGHNDAGKNSFGEVFGTAAWKGATARVSYNLNETTTGGSRFRRGDVFGDVGYTYKIAEKTTIGADIGYYWYASNPNVATVNGVAVTTLRAGYALNDHVKLSLSHQLSGHAPSGDQAEGNHRTTVNAVYSF